MLWGGCGHQQIFCPLFLDYFWPDLQRCGVKDPTRAALNPGLCNEVDRRIHEWANHNDQGFAAIIAGHTHRAVFENLSLTERRYLKSKVKNEGVKIKHQPDVSYYNTGSCVHPLSITGIEITYENTTILRLVEWGQATEGNVLTIQKYASFLMICTPCHSLSRRKQGAFLQSRLNSLILEGFVSSSEVTFRYSNRFSGPSSSISQTHS